MTRDEQRQAWRTYAAALSTRQHVTMTHQCAAWADVMLEEERNRFDTPDHSADSGKMVEPREWVDLTDAEITQIVAAYYATYDDLVRLTQDRLREKNGGTR
jgi:hypothetical protein